MNTGSDVDPRQCFESKVHPTWKNLKLWPIFASMILHGGQRGFNQWTARTPPFLIVPFFTTLPAHLDRRQDKLKAASLMIGIQGTEIKNFDVQVSVLL